MERIYKTRAGSLDIIHVDCIASTKNSVTIMRWHSPSMDRRPVTVPRVSEIAVYHDTWEQARDHLATQTRHALDLLQEQTHEKSELLRKIEALTPPDQQSAVVTHNVVVAAMRKHYGGDSWTSAQLMQMRETLEAAFKEMRR